MTDSEIISVLLESVQKLTRAQIQTNEHLIQTKESYEAIFSALATEIADLKSESRDSVIQRWSEKAKNSDKDFLKVVR